MHRLLRYLVHGWVWLPALGLIILSVQLSGPDGPLRYQAYAEPGRNAEPYLFSADGRLLLLRDGHVLRLPDGQVLRIVKLSQAAFSTNGAILAVRPSEDRRDVLREGQINLFRTSDQSPPVVVRVETRELSSLAVTNVGTLLAVGDDAIARGAVTIYDTQANRVVARVPTDGGYLGQLLFTPDDRYLLVPGVTRVRMFDTATWQLVYQSDVGEPRAIAFAGSTQLLAIQSGTYDQAAFMMVAFQDGVAQTPRRIPAPYAFMSGFTFSPDGQYLAVIEHASSGPPVYDLFRSGPYDAPIRMALVRVADGAVIQRFEGTKGDMQLPAFTPDGQQIMTSIGSRPGLLFWQVAPRAPWNIGLRLLPALLGLLLMLEQVRRFIVRGM
jgi:dipeptidyl aminopeptidase/acylaminoacyl peptidase